MHELPLRNPQPPEQLAFVGAGPQRGVALPQAAHLVILFPIRDGGLNQSFQLLGQEVELAVEAHARTPAVLPVASNNCAKASAKSLTPSTTSFSVTSFMEIPAFSSEAMVFAASSTFSVRLGRKRP